jgi:hypothetical protein
MRGAKKGTTPLASTPSLSTFSPIFMLFLGYGFEYIELNLRGFADQNRL